MSSARLPAGTSSPPHVLDLILIGCAVALARVLALAALR
jgi:hypothetical protein